MGNSHLDQFRYGFPLAARSDVSRSLRIDFGGALMAMTSLFDASEFAATV